MSFHVRKRIFIELVHFFPHDVEWSTDNFFMDIGDVERDKSESHKCDTHDPRIQYDDENDITERVYMGEYLIEYDEYSEKWCPYGDEKSEISHELEWKERERSETMEC
jgi:hypothetical protein